MFRNLIAGFKLAFFLKCDARDFRISLMNLWVIFFLAMAADCGLEYYYYQHPVVFMPDGLKGETFYFVAILFASFLISQIFRLPDLALAIPLMVFNAIFFAATVYKTIYLMHPFWLHTARDWRRLYILHCVWYFIIFFRILLFYTGTKAKRQCIAALLLILAICVPDKYIYFDYFWYEKDAKEDSSEPEKPKLFAEDAFSPQSALLQKQLQALTPRAGERTIYSVVFAGYGHQEVFLKEAVTARKVIEDRYHAKGHSMLLVNNPKTLEQYPLASLSNLQETLQYMGKAADPKKDMLLLYLTSHGSKEGRLALDLETIEFKPLDGPALKKVLAQSGFKWKVVIVSACYSGNFIDALKDDDTLVITSARKDRTSFGCGDEFDMTYFGDAYFRQALPKTKDFVRAFDIANDYIKKREEEELIEEHSEPQIFVGPAIAKYLDPN